MFCLRKKIRMNKEVIKELNRYYDSQIKCLKRRKETFTSFLNGDLIEYLPKLVDVISDPKEKTYVYALIASLKH